MKKILLTLITSLLLITNCPIQTILSEENNPQEIVLLEQENEVEAKGIKISPEVIKELEKLNTDGASGFINGIQSVVSVISSVSYVFTAYNGIFNFLKSIGVVESPEGAVQKQILEKMNEIQNTINDMNEKLDGIVEELDKNFAEVDLNFDDVKVRLDKQNISAFTTNYENIMLNRLSNFENTLQTKVKDWFTNTKQDLTLSISYVQTKSDVLITEENIDEVINKTKQDKNKNVDVTLSQTLLNEVFKDVVWDKTTYEEDIKNAMKVYFNNSDDTTLKEWGLRYLLENDQTIPFTEDVLNDETSISEAWTNYVLVSDTYKNELKDGFATNFSQALMNVFYMEIVEEGKGTSSQYVNGVCNEFRNYINSLVDTSSSPYVNQLDILPKIYLFQKETKDIVADLRTYYITNLTRYAIFYLGVMGACDIGDYDSYVSLYNDAIDKIVDYFDSFLIKDGNGNVVDNYCYVIGAPIEFESVSLTSNAKVYHEQYTNHMFGIDYEVYNGYSATPWKFSESNANMVGNQDMLKISALYKHLGEEGQSLNNYLQMNMFGEIKIAFDGVQTIVTNYQGTKTFNLSEKVHMFVGMPGIGRSTYFPVGMWDKYVNDGKPSEIKDDGFVVHDSAVGDTFNLNNLSLSTSNKLESRAVFGKHSSAWIKDEMCFFYSKNYPTQTDTKTKSDDGHDFFTAEMNTYGTYFVIKKGSSVAEPSTENYIDCNNLNDVSELKIDNTNKYYEENDKTRSYIMYFNEQAYYGDDEAENELIKQGFINFINDQDTIDGMKQANKDRVDKINSIGEFKDGYYELDISNKTIDKIVDKINESANKNNETLTSEELSSLLNLPTKSDDCKVVISVIYLPVFKVDKDDNLYHYSTYDMFVLRPYLVWNNGKDSIEITDSIINELGLTFNVKIPIVNNYEIQNRAYINHYDSKYNILEPKEVLKGYVKSNYIEFKTNSFSPFAVDSYYYEAPYTPVKTGIE